MVIARRLQLLPHAIAAFVGSFLVQVFGGGAVSSGQSYGALAVAWIARALFVVGTLLTAAHLVARILDEHASASRAISRPGSDDRDAR